MCSILLEPSPTIDGKMHSIEFEEQALSQSPFKTQSPTVCSPLFRSPIQSMVFDRPRDGMRHLFRAKKNSLVMEQCARHKSTQKSRYFAAE